MPSKATVESTPELHKGSPLEAIHCQVMTFAAGVEANSEGWPVPEWIHLCPAGELVEGRDGRSFKVDDPSSLLEGSEPLKMFADIDHRSFDYNGSTEALGWVQELAYLDEGENEGPRQAAGYWARMKWTSDGRELIASGKMRGISPVVRVRYDTDEEGYLTFPGTAIGFARSFALTNMPNLEMTLLNRTTAAEPSDPPEAAQNKDTRMNEILIALATKMGLASDATEKDLDQAFMTLTAERDEARTEAATHRARLAEVEAERFAESVEHAFAEATKSGRMTPAEAVAFRKIAKDPAGLAAFSEIMAARPERMSTDGSDDPEIDPPPTSKALTPMQQEIARSKGLTDEQYREGLEA